MTGPHPTVRKLTEKNISDVLQWIVDNSDGELDLTETVKDMADCADWTGEEEAEEEDAA